MRKILSAQYSLSTFTLLVMISISSLISTNAHAINYGELDGSTHPSTGALISPTQYSDGTWLYCSGTLISPTVFLTAAHCDSGNSRVSVTFDSEFQVGKKVHTGTFHANPLFDQKQSDTQDIAVVIFDMPVSGIVPAKLPTAGSLSTLPNNQQFASVGFGAHTTKGPGGHQFIYTDVRNTATGTLSATNKAWLRISQNPSLGNGGTCYGDSGGPNFLGNTDTIAAITVTGDAKCHSRNVTYRLDTKSSRDFLRSFVTLP